MLLNNEHLTRQLDLLPIDKLGEPITIVGAGAIGGWVTLALAKMGFGNLRVFDFDEVEVENLSCQIYGRKSLGTSKVQSLGLYVKALAGVDIQAVPERYTGGVCNGIVIAAVDSMEVRKLIWQSHKGISGNTRAIIDPRMGAETALLYVMNPMSAKDAESYEKTLYSDEAAVREPCTRKATAYCALALSGLVCAQVKSLVTGNPYSRITQWDIPKGAMQAWESSSTS